MIVHLIRSQSEKWESATGERKTRFYGHSFHTLVVSTHPVNIATKKYVPQRRSVPLGCGESSTPILKFDWSMMTGKCTLNMATPAVISLQHSVVEQSILQHSQHGAGESWRQLFLSKSRAHNPPQTYDVRERAVTVSKILLLVQLTIEFKTGWGHVGYQ